MTPQNATSTAKNGPSRRDDARPASQEAGARSEPLTAEERAVVRADHRRDDIVTPTDAVIEYCVRCYLWDEGWPCATIRLLDEVEAAWVAIEADPA